MELETAVRPGCNLVNAIWRDGFYDRVRFQEEMKYGRRSGADFGPIDTVKFAEAVGAQASLSSARRISCRSCAKRCK
jgi:acetolactate synthase I/II/III large subunit